MTSWRDTSPEPVQDDLDHLLSLADGADAVRVESEHRGGGPGIVVLAPCRRRGLLRRTVEHGDLSAGPGPRRTWPA